MPHAVTRCIDAAARAGTTTLHMDSLRMETTRLFIRLTRLASRLTMGSLTRLQPRLVVGMDRADVYGLRAVCLRAVCPRETTAGGAHSSAPAARVVNVKFDSTLLNVAVDVVGEAAEVAVLADVVVATLGRKSLEVRQATQACLPAVRASGMPLKRLPDITTLSCHNTLIASTWWETTAVLLST